MLLQKHYKIGACCFFLTFGCKKLGQEVVHTRGNKWSTFGLKYLKAHVDHLLTQECCFNNGFSNLIFGKKSLVLPVFGDMFFVLLLLGEYMWTTY